MLSPSLSFQGPTVWFSVIQWLLCQSLWFSDLLSVILCDPVTDCVNLCDPVTDCVILCDSMTDCVILCDSVTDCVILCDPVTDCEILCNPVTDCEILCDLVTDCEILCDPVTDWGYSVVEFVWQLEIISTSSSYSLIYFVHTNRWSGHRQQEINNPRYSLPDCWARLCCSQPETRSNGSL